MKKILLIVAILIILTITFLSIYKNIEKKNKKEMELEKRNTIKTIENNYNEIVKTRRNSVLYSAEFKEIGKVYEDNYLFLDKISIDENTKYFKVMNKEIYVKYEDVEKADEYKIDYRYKKYVYFDEQIITKPNFKLYKNDKQNYQFNEPITKQIIRKNKDGYYIEYNNELVYVKKDDVAAVTQTESTSSATNIPVIAYHYIHHDEDKSCKQIICHPISQIREQFTYLNENNYLTIDTNELELFFDKEIRLPEKTVLLTVDDGGYAENLVPLLNEYNIKATLFLIVSYYDKNNFKSPNLEISSHTYNLHIPDKCPGGQGSPLKCLDKNLIVEDLKKSREILDNTRAFCYPYYEYNNYSENILKEVGFTLAFVGGQRKASINSNKLRIPRITLFSDTTLKEFISYIN